MPNHSQSAYVHKGAHIAATDPETTYGGTSLLQPDVIWINTSSAPYPWKKRNAGNTGWDALSFKGQLDANGQVLSGVATPVSGTDAANKTYVDGVAGAAAPFVDSTAIVKGSGDATKQLRFEVDGFTTGTTRVLTAPDYNGTIATLAGAETLTNKTLGSTIAVTAAISFTAGVKQTFAPDATNAGLNAGSVAGNPSSLANGDIWYDSTANALKARINGSTVSLGAGGGGSGTVNTGASGNIAYYPSAGTTVDDVPGFTSDASGNLTAAASVSTSGSPTLLTVTGPAHTTLAAGTEAPDLHFNLARTVQFATGALSLQRAVRFRAPTWAFVGASTLSDAINVDIDTPTPGTNATFTRSTGLRVKGNNNADCLVWLDHKISSTGEVLAMGLVASKVVRFISNGGTINSVINGSGSALSSSATDGFLWLGEYSGTGAPSGTPTSYTGAEPLVMQRDNINAIYDLWAYSNSAWRSIGGQFKRYDTTSGNGAQTIDFNSSASAVVSRQFTASGGNATLTFSNPPRAGSVVVIMIVQDGSGSRTITWPASVKWQGGSGNAPTLTTTAAAKDIFSFLYDGTNYYELSRQLNVS